MYLFLLGTLPRLVVHFNEDKLFALERMTRLLLGGVDGKGGDPYSGMAAGTDMAVQTDEEPR